MDVPRNDNQTTHLQLASAESDSNEPLQTSDQPKLQDVLVSFPVRLACYAVIALVMVQALFMGLIAYGPGYIGAENGPVETAQVYLSLFASFCLFYSAYHCRRGRAGLITCAAMVGYAAARESDSIFEAVFFDDAYKYLVGLPLFIGAVGALFIDRRRVVGDAMWLVRQPAVTLFAIGGIYLCTFCQILDRPDLWTSITSESEAKATKAMIEEFAEFFAYAILAFSGVESLALAHRLDATSMTILQDEETTESPEVAPPIAA